MLLELEESEELFRESSRDAKSAKSELVSALLEPGPPRLVACWISLKVEAAESVSPEVM